MAVCRLLNWAAGLSAPASPEERLQGEAAVQLAVRLGLKPTAMLAALLSLGTGITFYHHFPAVVMMCLSPLALCHAHIMSGFEDVDCRDKGLLHKYETFKMTLKLRKPAGDFLI